ncbi:MAG: hypothetical protein RL094_171 [Candidatus Parcubacteria bacterium]
MTPSSLDQAKKRFISIRKAALKHRNIEVGICPPSPYVFPLAQLAKKGKIKIGSQDVSVHSEGSHTGEIGASMFETSGAVMTLIGHSERRAAGDTDAIVATKISQALKTDMTIVLCVGESDRDDHGEYLNVIRKQLKEAINQLGRSQFAQLVIAYEPVWAIGRKDNVAITSHDLHQMVIFIKKFLKELWGETISSIVPVLYGGSVTAENAHDILWNGEVDGLLIGRASWEVESLSAIFDAIDVPRKTLQVKKKAKR